MSIKIALSSDGLPCLYQPEIDAAEKRIAQLEAEVAHYKEWLKERTAELESHLNALDIWAGEVEHRDKRIAELEGRLGKWEPV